MFLWKKLELEPDLLGSVHKEEPFSNNGLWGRYFEVLSSENWNKGLSRRYIPVLN
jgi:hypothetical protein